MGQDLSYITLKNRTITGVHVFTHLSLPRDCLPTYRTEGASLIVSEATLKADWDRCFNTSLSVTLYLSPPSRKWLWKQFVTSKRTASAWHEDQTAWFTAQPCEQGLDLCWPQFIKSLSLQTSYLQIVVNFCIVQRQGSGQTTGNKIQVLAIILTDWSLTTCPAATPSFSGFQCFPTVWSLLPF